MLAPFGRMSVLIGICVVTLQLVCRCLLWNKFTEHDSISWTTNGDYSRVNSYSLSDSCTSVLRLEIVKVILYIMNCALVQSLVSRTSIRSILGIGICVWRQLTSIEDLPLPVQEENILCYSQYASSGISGQSV